MAALLGTNIGFFLLTFLPPVLWLLFYLREDKHPEPKSLLILTFIGGMASAILALLAECAWVFLYTNSCSVNFGPDISPLILFGGISLIEEYVKYLPVKFLVISRCKNHASCDFDEPIDAMIYMMTAALGFAALENVLFVLPIFQNNVFASLEVAASRFIGANLLHALSSGIVGFFLARAWFHPHRHHFILLGILIASVLHTIFNYLILIKEALSQSMFYIILLLATMAIMVFIDFERLKKPKI
jgi:RsiW-degrading membrane proteinase PrsW (M82 family)